MSASIAQIILLGFGLAGALFIIIAQTPIQAGFALGILYIVSFFQILAFWPAAQAIIKLITGLIAVVLLILPTRSNQRSRTRVRFTPIWFRFAAGLIAWALGYAITPALNNWLPVSPYLLIYCLVLIFDGLFVISLTEQPIMHFLGLLLALCGFETIYAALEASALVTAALSIITISLAMLGSFMQARIS